MQAVLASRRLCLCRLAAIAALIGGASPPVAAQQPPELVITELRLGFNGNYKLGCWTQAEVVVEGGDEAFTGIVEITTRDPEGVPNTVVTPRDRAIAVLPGKAASAHLFVRSGQDGAGFHVRIIDERGRERASRHFLPGVGSDEEIVKYGLPATNRVIASFGARRDLKDVIPGDPADEDLLATRTVNVTQPGDLPLEWYGYEALDTLVLGSSRAERYRAVGASQQRIEALVRWVELGGRVVVFCGDEAPELIGPDGPLAGLMPGKYDALVPLRESQPIESFANAEASLTQGRQFQIQVPRLTDVEGEILAFAGQNPADLPLVIRARRGLGEVTFVALDPDAPPIADWPGRLNLLRLALQLPADADEYAGVQGDLTDRVRQSLDGSFIGVKPAPFALVALLVILYILLIGPGDYFFVKRVLKRMELTWLTFPLIVLVVSAGAYWAAHYMKGDKLRVNQVEIVDVDMSTGQARGTVWTHFFSPRVERYDLTLAPKFGKDEIAMPSEADGQDAAAPQRLVAWLGATGYGLDGMEGRRAQAGLFERGYSFSPQLTEIVGLPVQEWSTRTLIGRWSAELVEPVDATLRGLADDLLAGNVANRTGVALDQCLLMHGNWAYKLPDLADGAAVAIDDSLQPTSVKTALASLAEVGEAGGDPSSTAPRLSGSSTDVDQLVLAMMFNEAMGGLTYSQTPNRYQAFVDLSRLLRGQQAILLARVAQPTGSQWTNGDAPLASDQDRRWVFYRFVIPLEEQVDSP